MSRDSIMRLGRIAAEAGMTDTKCTVRRKTGAVTHDPDTGQVVPEYDILLTNQPCRVQTRGFWGERRDVGQDGVVQWTQEVQFPLSVTVLEVNDEVEITASVNDPTLIGRQMLVRDLNHKTHATARRVLCTMIVG